MKWPGQVVIAGCQTYWTTEVSNALDEGNLPELYQKMLGQVHNIVARPVIGLYVKIVGKGSSTFCASFVGMAVTEGALL